MEEAWQGAPGAALLAALKGRAALARAAAASANEAAAVAAWGVSRARAAPDARAPAAAAADAREQAKRHRAMLPERVDCDCGDAHPPGQVSCGACMTQPMLCCDVCNRWMHMPCLGVTATAVPLGDYCCSRCRPLARPTCAPSLVPPLLPSATAAASSTSCTGSASAVGAAVAVPAAALPHLARVAAACGAWAWRSCHAAGVSATPPSTSCSTRDASSPSSLPVVVVALPPHAFATVPLRHAILAAASAGTVAPVTPCAPAAPATCSKTPARVRAAMGASPARSPAAPSLYDALPPPVLTQLAGYLAVRDAAALERTCRSARALATSPAGAAAWRVIDGDGVPPGSSMDRLLARAARRATQVHQLTLPVAGDVALPVVRQLVAGNAPFLTRLALRFCAPLDDAAVVALLQPLPPAPLTPRRADARAAAAAASPPTVPAAALRLRSSDSGTPNTDDTDDADADAPLCLPPPPLLRLVPAPAPPTGALMASLTARRPPSHVPPPPLQIAATVAGSVRRRTSAPPTPLRPSVCVPLAVGAPLTFQRLTCCDFAGARAVWRAATLHALLTAAPALRHLALQYSGTPAAPTAWRDVAAVVTAAAVSQALARADAAAGASRSMLSAAAEAAVARLYDDPPPAPALALLRQPDGARWHLCGTALAVVVADLPVHEDAVAAGDDADDDGGGGGGGDGVAREWGTCTTTTLVVLPDGLGKCHPPAVAQLAGSLRAAVGRARGAVDAAAAVWGRADDTDADADAGANDGAVAVPYDVVTPLRRPALLRRDAFVNAVHLLAAATAAACTCLQDATGVAAGAATSHHVAAASHHVAAASHHVAAASHALPLRGALPWLLARDPRDARLACAHALAAAGMPLVEVADVEDSDTPLVEAHDPGAAPPAPAVAAAARAARDDGLRLAREYVGVPAALEALSASLALVPDARLHLRAAWLADRTYRWAVADAHCRAALALAPTCGNAALQLAGAATQAGRAAAGDADAWLNRAEGATTFLAGTLHHVYEERGTLRIRARQRRDAVAALRVALALAPWRASNGDADVARLLKTALGF